MRLAYADPPYPGKAHLYPENTEVDHGELIARLCEYDGWALSTDEVNLAGVLALCPPRTRVLAWCRSTAPPLGGNPFASWEPVLCIPARVSGVEKVRSYTVTHAATGPAQRNALTGQKTPAFCEWVIRCLGAKRDDALDDLFPGTGIMGETFDRFQRQDSIPMPEPQHPEGAARRLNRLRRVSEPLPGFAPTAHLSERSPLHKEGRTA